MKFGNKRRVQDCQYVDFADNGGNSVRIGKLRIMSDRPYRDLKRGRNGLFCIEYECEPEIGRKFLEDETLPGLYDFDIQEVPGTRGKATQVVVGYERIGDIEIVEKLYADKGAK